MMNSKAVGEGYKIYSLCCPNGYIVDFRFTSGVSKVAELGQWPGFSTSEAVVLDLAETLTTRFPRPSPFYVLHIDNFFTTRKLYEQLHSQGIGANGSAKAGSGVPRELVLLREVMPRQTDHGRNFNYVVGNVNCIAFCDMATSVMMSTVHDPTQEEYEYFDPAKRPGASLSNSKPAVSSNNEEFWRLRKLYALHDYNQHMGGSDLYV